MKNKIIVPTDFTIAANKAVEQAVVIAGRFNASLTLFHVVDHTSDPAGAVKAKMDSEAERIRQNTGVACDVLIKEGSIFDVIPLAVCEKDFDLMVIATHGLKGIRQLIFGADILKLISKIPIPVLVLQEESPLVDTFQKIVLPVGSHENFQQAVDAALLFSGIYHNMEVYFYSIEKPGYDWSKQLLANIAETTQRMEEQGVRMIRVKAEQEGFSPGYASQTLNYAKSIGADAILIMSGPSEELHYMAKAYKETVLLNEFHLPVLCAGGGGCV